VAYVKDNEGSGFAIDDSEGMEEILAAAEAAGERGTQDADSDEDSLEALLSKGGRPTPPAPRPTSAPTPPARPAQAEMSWDDIVPAAAPEESAPAPAPLRPRTPQEPPALAVPAPRQPEPALSVPASPPAPASGSYSASPAPAAPVAAPRVSFPTEAEEVERARRIIKVADEYRALSPDVKTVVAQFVNTSQELSEEEEVVVVRALHADKNLFDTMVSLRTAKEAEPVERAFYVLSLSDTVLYSLGQLVSAFISKEIAREMPRLEYAKALVGYIHQLDSRAIEYVTATERLLTAARG